MADNRRMANAQPSADYSKRFPAPSDTDDLLTADGCLSHGGRAYRRDLIARMLASLVAKRGSLSAADVMQVIATANTVVRELTTAPHANPVK